MEIWKDNRIDERCREDILHQIAMLASSYTPEWKFDCRNPDAGSVIGMIFANQQLDNIGKLNLLLDKYHIEFANMYGLSLKAAAPAATVMILKPAEGGASGIWVKKGTQVIGKDKAEEEITFETMQDIYVTGAKLTDMLAISGRKDKILRLMSQEEEQVQQKIPLFSYEEKGIRQQKLLLYHSYLFDLQSRTVRLRFRGRINGKQHTEELADLFADTKRFCFSYMSEEGIFPFDEVKKQGDTIRLYRSCEEHKQKIHEQTMSVIILQAEETPEETIELEQVEIVTQSQQERPDFIFDGTTELAKDSFWPFGKQLSLYRECYIGQKNLFRQKGMLITLQFDLAFAEYRVEDSRIKAADLRVIKRKPRANPDRGYYECFVQEAALEYFNGKGWKKLTCDRDITQLFGQQKNAGKHRITFEIPNDWEPTIQGGYEQKCIRLQIIRADNCYLQEVRYCYPVISGLSMELSYQQETMYPEKIQRIHGSFQEDCTRALSAKEPFTAFSRSMYTGDYIYLGFDRKFEQGPIGFFLELEENQCEQSADIQFSYSANTGFKPLAVIDRTQSLAHSGNILFLPPADMAEQEIEGVRRYWIRLEDIKGCFAHNQIPAPVLKHFYINAVDIANIETGEEQDFFLDTVSANMSFPLHADNILSAKVWVNEIEQLSEREKERMLRETPGQVRAEYNFMGELAEFYVLWREIDTFDLASGQERCYVIDRCSNCILFGDGMAARIPRNTESIAFKVRVIRCHGEKGNVEAFAVNNFRGNMLAVAEVMNPVPAFGGNNMEEIQTALIRGSNILGSRRRLVSETDYIREARLFSDTIDKVACVVGMRKNGEKNSSVISLVLLMKDYAYGSYAFRNVEKKLKQYLLSHCEMIYQDENIEITEPIFVKISLKLWVTIPDITRSIEIRQRWLNRIEEYIEPVGKQNKWGWKIGKLPSEKQIRQMAGVMEKEASIRRLSIYAVYEDTEGVHEVSLDSLAGNPFMVCCNGEHQLNISEEKGINSHR